MLNTGELFAAIRDNHVLGLTEDQQRILAARMCGLTTSEIAERLFRGERSVRSTFERVADLVCVPLGIRRDPVVTGWWFGLHSTCEKGCASLALEMIQSGDGLFAAAPAAAKTAAKTAALPGTTDPAG